MAMRIDDPQIPAEVLKILNFFPEMQPVAAPPLVKAPPKKTRGKPLYTDEYEREVWGPYPRKEGTSKANAFRKFEALDADDRAAIKAAIPVYARQKSGKEAQFICHLEFFISRRIFETVGVPNVAPAAPPPAIDWARVMALYARTGNWNVELGPAPGQPGCRVPKEFLK